MSKIDEALALMDDGARMADACRAADAAKAGVSIAWRYKQTGREEMRERIVAALRERADVVVSCGKVADAIERMGKR